MKSELKTLYLKDNKLAIKVAKILGYKINAKKSNPKVNLVIELQDLNYDIRTQLSKIKSGAIPLENMRNLRKVNQKIIILLDKLLHMIQD